MYLLFVRCASGLWRYDGVYIEGMGRDGADCKRTNINYLELNLHNLVYPTRLGMFMRNVLIGRRES